MTVINTWEKEGYRNAKVGEIWNDVGKMWCRRGALMMVEENEAMEQ